MRAAELCFLDFQSVTLCHGLLKKFVFYLGSFIFSDCHFQGINLEVLDTVVYIS